MWRLALVLVALATACEMSTTERRGAPRRYNVPLPDDETTTADEDGTEPAPASTRPAPPAPAGADVFADAGVYVAKRGADTAQDEDDHPFRDGNPAKQDCLTAGCHARGGSGPEFFAAGTVFEDRAGGVPAAKVEVRLRDADGTAISAFTDANGNFFVKKSAAKKMTFPLRAGARDETSERAMSAPITNGSCNDLACHGSAATGPIHVP